MISRILVINPNSNQTVTRVIDRSLRSCRTDAVIDISCITLDDGPFSIGTDEDISAAVPLVVREICARDDADAFVIACYSDPGLEESRNESSKTVFGIQESAVSLSAAYGRRFGVLALQRDAIQRHIAYVRQMGCQDFHAGERSLDITVDDAANDPDVLHKIIDTGRQLVEQDGAQTLILGCAGLAGHRKAAQLELGVPIIDPVEAAVTMAMEALGVQ